MAQASERSVLVVGLKDKTRKVYHTRVTQQKEKEKKARLAGQREKWRALLQ
jgi:hypothetical protein